ncbi:unnamed protein product [Gongylonema pulchrum]|uniref:Sec7_N domain-containing protein n=1 Tax=Gongylonema pulchrum TaxID=637853 RepID=A0A183D1A9_9BILA|nr:unnamed protein product [Gongylonema pulchrum]
MSFFQVTECEIFLSLLVKFLESDKLGWQRAIALEVLYRIVVLPDLLIRFCENYDGRPGATKIVQSIMSGFATYVQLSFMRCAASDSPSKDEEQHFDTTSQTMAQAGFLYRGVWMPLYQNIVPRKSLLLDSLEKHEAADLSDGYSLSLTYHCIIACCHSIFEAIESLRARKEKEGSDRMGSLNILAMQHNEQLLQCFTTLITLSCRISHFSGRDALYFALCKASLPPKYLVRVVGVTDTVGLSAAGAAGAVPETAPSLEHFQIGKDCSGGSFFMTVLNSCLRVFSAFVGIYKIENEIEMHFSSDSFAGHKTGLDKFESESAAGQPSQIVAVGIACPTPSLPSNFYNAAVVVCHLTAKNIQVARVLVSSAQANGQYLGDCWHLILASLQHLVWILRMTPSLQGGFRSDGDANDGSSLMTGSPSNSSVLTTAAMADVPVMVCSA